MDIDHRKPPSQENTDAQAQLLRAQAESKKNFTPAIDALNQELKQHLRGEAAKKEQSK